MKIIPPWQDKDCMWVLPVLGGVSAGATPDPTCDAKLIIQC